MTEEVRDAVLVPQVAVQDLQGAKTVLVVGEGDKVAMRTVTLREPFEQFYIVANGLQPGERVIVEGIQKARPGMQVKPEVRAVADAPPAPGKVQAPAASPPGEQAPAPGASPPPAKPKS
jgi:membrane fusion protein (multidrug efflux system)